MSFFDKIKKFFGIGNSPRITSKPGGIPRDDYSYNEIRSKKIDELNRILDKIARKGMESLSKKEKQFLDKEGKNL